MTLADENTACYPYTVYEKIKYEGEGLSMNHPDYIDDLINGILLVKGRSSSDGKPGGEIFDIYVPLSKCWGMDIRKAQRDIGYHPRVDLAEGVAHNRPVSERRVALKFWKEKIMQKEVEVFGVSYERYVLFGFQRPVSKRQRRS